MKKDIGPGWNWFGRRFCCEVNGMWTWERNRRLPLEEAVAELGLVTLGGDPAAIQQRLGPAGAHSQKQPQEDAGSKGQRRLFLL